MTTGVTPSRILEREVKLAVDLDLVLPDLDVGEGSTSHQPEQRLRTGYFDTADLRLWCRGITLRHRSGEARDAGTWTVKLPAHGKGPTLDRTELSWSGTRESMPAEVLSLLRGVIRTSLLNQIVELETTRRRLILRDSHGAAQGELDDDVVTVIGGGRSGLRFRQIEFELGPGGDALVGSVLKQLMSAGARHDGEQKLARALDLQALLAGHPAFRVRKGSSVADVVGASIVTGLERLLENDYRIRLDPSDPSVEAVHQARVATRRLRSELKMFAPALDPTWVAGTRTELKWLGEVLGRVRDADVLALVLHDEDMGSAFESEGLICLRSNLDEQRRIHCKDLLGVLDGSRYLTLLDRLEGATQAPPFDEGRHPQKGSAHLLFAEGSARQVMPRLVGKSWRALRREVRRAGRRPSDVELHGMRIRSKELRYVAEAAIPVIGKHARRTAVAAESAQGVLGDHHDAVSAEAWLRSQAKLGPLAASYVAGRLAAEEARSRQALREQWRTAWHHLDQRRVRSWFQD